MERALSQNGLQRNMAPSISRWMTFWSSLWKGRHRRDILFAEKVKAECENRKIPCLVNDGMRTEDELFATVEKLFALTGF